ncbi:unnamed protein product, partial [Rotaria sp. Silwood2]
MDKQYMQIFVQQQVRQLTKFGGKFDEDVIQWLKDTEYIFDRVKLQSSNKYLAVQSYLVGAAEKWFRYNKSTVVNWPTFKVEIIKAFQRSCHQAFLKMEQRLQLPHESVMEYYSDKIHLCLQADSNMSLSIIIHHLIKGLTQSLIPHVIRRHPSTPADFLTIAQGEEQIQFTLNDLSRVSINPPDNNPNNNDPIDASVMVVTPHINTEKRSPHYQQLSLFLPSRAHDQHQFTFNKNRPLDLLNDEQIESAPDLSNDEQIEPFPVLNNKCLHEDEQDYYSSMLNKIDDINLEIQKLCTVETDHGNEVKQHGEYVTKSSPVKTDIEHDFEAIASSTDSLTADATLIDTVVPQDVQNLWPDKYPSRKPRLFDKVYIGYEWNPYDKKRYDIDTPTPYENIAFTIVSKAWVHSYHYESRCYFQNGKCQLWFYYREIKY